MKETQLLLQFLPFLLFAILASSGLCYAAVKPQAVLNSYGNIVEAGNATVYHILPATAGTGGVTMEPLFGERCPLGVVQNKSPRFQGNFVSFYPANPKERVVHLSTDLNIDFTDTDIHYCRNTFWKLDSYDPKTRNYFVVTNGAKGNPGPKTVNSWFKIEKFENAYKLVYCPTVCKTCKVMCKDIGIVVHNGYRRLALSDVPFKVVFKKA